ncbi:MAG: MBL fold metallo-hydrolase, partial [Rikenellaceae bacterium]
SGSVVYGMRIGDMPSKIDIYLDAIEQIRFGQTTLKIIECPGHTPGHISLFNEQDRTLLTGDTIFKESIGRTDLPGGDYHQLMHSITKNIITLGDDVEIFPGHGGSTSIGQEVLYNPFIVEVINKEVNY